MLFSFKFVENYLLMKNNKDAQVDLNNILFLHTERVKELQGINKTVALLNQNKPLDESLQEICSLIPQAWQYPGFTCVRITYHNNTFVSKNFSETPWKQSQSFDIPGGKSGSIEVFYLKEFPELDEGPFMKEERDLIDNFANLISGSLTKDLLRKLMTENSERLKELRGINQISNILKQERKLEDALREICNTLPFAWQYPEYTAARIIYDNQVYTSSFFYKTRWVIRQTFETQTGKKGIIEVYYLKDFPMRDEGPFLKEERTLIDNLADIISGIAAKKLLSNLVADNTERLKELQAINKTTAIISAGKTVEDTLQEICDILPVSWQYPEQTVARITFEDVVAVSRPFRETIWRQIESFVTINNKKGWVEIFYLEEFPKLYEGPFLKEERNLIVNIAQLIAGYLNNCIGRDALYKRDIVRISDNNPNEYRDSLIKKSKPLQQYFNQQTLDKYIYLDMMKYKVKEILFVATFYDAFILENEDAFFEQFMGEIYQYSLFSLPRITAVTSDEQALHLADSSQFDFVILTVGEDEKAPCELAKQIKELRPDLPVFLLLNKKGNVKYFETLVGTSKFVDKLFIWHGDSQIFFAIVKSIEDRINVENDTNVGLVRLILLIEDSPQYYSKYLSILYSIVFGHIQKIIASEKNELDKISKMRSRPKILLATNYEEAIYIYNKYRNFMQCVISDVEFEKNGVLNKTAGLNFLKYVKSQDNELPMLLQSSDKRNAAKAKTLGVGFIDKNSENLSNELMNFIIDNIGFGDFIFRDENNKRIAIARNLREFETLLLTVPAESLLYHGRKNHFSFWLMARGEIHIAKILNPIKTMENEDQEEVRKFLLKTIDTAREDKKRGRVLSFDESFDFTEKNIVSMASGSLGGKGRGLAFINTLIYNLDFSAYTKEINIRTPITAIIGTDEFVTFMNRNDLFDRIYKEKNFEKTKALFIEGKLSHRLIKRLKIFITQVKKPIAVRSSSLFEDSLSHPFAGIFDTFIIPNNQAKDEERLESLVTAIKLVFASVFSNQARTYYKAVHHRIEEEKMAIVLQELVGDVHDKYYYPHISGTAQSYNFYPVAHMTPDDGFAVIAMGLGTYVVEGGRSFRFSPKYPQTDVISLKDLLRTTQVKFFAVDMSIQDINYMKHGDKAALVSLDISEAEKHDTIRHCVSVYNANNDCLMPGTNSKGPRVMNFANILNYDYIPLSKTINVILKTVKEALGSPVEIEFAVDLNLDKNGKASFYLLQIKPLVGNQLSFEIDPTRVDPEKVILYSEASMGNGKIDYITDIIFMDIDQFNKLRTLEMAEEIEFLNTMMLKQNRQYILIGPGRWGTQDKSVGIPVTWPQICNAKIIVELGLPDFPLDASLGSHFFHNVTSMNIGYFSVQHGHHSNFLRWEKLNGKLMVHRTKYFKHIRFEKPVTVLMDGRKRKAIILESKEE